MFAPAKPGSLINKGFPVFSYGRNGFGRFVMCVSPIVMCIVFPEICVLLHMSLHIKKSGSYPPALALIAIIAASSRVTRSWGRLPSVIPAATAASSSSSAQHLS